MIFIYSTSLFLGGKKPAQKAKEKAPPPINRANRAYYESCTEPSSEEDDEVRDPDFNNSSVLQDLHGNSYPLDLDFFFL